MHSLENLLLVDILTKVLIPNRDEYELIEIVWSHNLGNGNDLLRDCRLLYINETTIKFAIFDDSIDVLKLSINFRGRWKLHCLRGII